jgi:hypothetical protein
MVWVVDPVEKAGTKGIARRVSFTFGGGADAAAVAAPIAAPACCTQLGLHLRWRYPAVGRVVPID